MEWGLSSAHVWEARVCGPLFCGRGERTGRWRRVIGDRADRAKTINRLNKTHPIGELRHHRQRTRGSHNKLALVLHNDTFATTPPVPTRYVRKTGLVAALDVNETLISSDEGRELAAADAYATEVIARAEGFRQTLR